MKTRQEVSEADPQRKKSKPKITVLKISELWLVWKKVMPNMVPTWSKHDPGMVPNGRDYRHEPHTMMSWS